MTDKKRTDVKQKEKVMVTGAGGFIGSHLVESLLKKGYDVVCLEKPGENISWLEGLDVTLIHGDITEKNQLYDPVKEVSYIYHLAASTGGNDKPSYLYKVNYEGTKNLLEVCADSGMKLKRFLFVSSFAAVGATGDSRIYNETVPPPPTTDYGKSKLMAETQVRKMGDHIPYTIVRLPLVYGPRCLGGMYTYFKLINKRFQFIIGRNDTNVGFVNDIVNGMILAAESPVALGQIYFLGEDRIYSTHEIIKKIVGVIEKRTIKIRLPYSIIYFLAFLAETFADFTGSYPVVRRHSLSAYLNSNWRFSMKKAREELNYKTEYPLDRGLKITADWYKINGYI